MLPSKNSILASSQYGFRENTGTEDALAQLSRAIYNKLEQKNKMLGIFMHISNAFGCFFHSLLLNISKPVGKVLKTFNLIKSYLQNRKQEVKISHILSNKIVINNDVPH